MIDDTSLIRSVIATLAYFDTFDYPLTATELHTYLWQSPNTGLNKFLQDLDRLKNNGTIRQCGGYYFLPGRQDIIAARERALRHIAHKLDRAKKAGKLI